MNTPPTAYTARQLAERFALQLQGDGDTAIHGVATLASAGTGQLSFLSNPRYRSQLAGSAAAVVVLRAEDADAAPGTALIARDPYIAFARIAALFEPVPSRPPASIPAR